MEWPQSLPYLSDWRVIRFIVFLMRVFGVVMWILPTVVMVWCFQATLDSPWGILAGIVALIIGEFAGLVREEFIGGYFGGVESYVDLLPNRNNRSLKQHVTIPVIGGLIPVLNVIILPFILAWGILYGVWRLSYWLIVGDRL
jgi:hypothetical protein